MLLPYLKGYEGPKGQTWTVEQFETDDILPCMYAYQPPTVKGSISPKMWAFDLPKKLFMTEVMKVGISRDFQNYRVN